MDSEENIIFHILMVLTSNNLRYLQYIIDILKGGTFKKNFYCILLERFFLLTTKMYFKMNAPIAVSKFNVVIFRTILFPIIVNNVYDDFAILLFL